MNTAIPSHRLYTARGANVGRSRVPHPTPNSPAWETVLRLASHLAQTIPLGTYALSCIILIAATVGALAGPPSMMAYQGRVTAKGVAFSGTGRFKFALVSGTGTQTFWSHDGSSASGAEPSSAVPIPVVNGLYSVRLGDTNISGMSVPLSSKVFAENGDVRLRVWFSDGAHGFQLLTPDQHLASVGYALTAEALTGPLPANVARLDGNQTFTGAVNFSNADNRFAGSFQGEGSGLTHVPGTQPARLITAPPLVGEPNTDYLAAGSGTSLVTAPATAKVGDIIRVSGGGAGDWKLSLAPIGAAWVAHDDERNYTAITSSEDGVKLAATTFPGQIYTSSDSGLTWFPHGPVKQWTAIASSADGTKLVACETGNPGDGFGLIRTSTDSGVTWTPHASPRRWSSGASSADGTRLVAVANEAGPIYTSSDSGASWTERGASRVWIRVASSANGSRLVASCAPSPGNPPPPTVYVSSDYGATWRPVISDSSYWFGVASSADGNSLVAVQGAGRIHTSSDGGTTWTPRETARGWFGVASSADGLTLAAWLDPNLGGPMYISADAGVTWKPGRVERWWGAALSADGAKASAVARQLFTSREIALQGGPNDAGTAQYGITGTWVPVRYNNVFADPDSRVGIGTATPVAALQVSPRAPNGEVLVLGTDPHAGGHTALVFGLTQESQGQSFIQGISASGSSYGDILLNRDGGNVGIGTPAPGARLHVTHPSIGSPADWGVRLDNQANTSGLRTGMRVSNDAGYFEISSEASAANPRFARLSGTGNWSPVSDGRLKEAVEPLSNILPKALALRPVAYRFRNHDPRADGEKEIGFIAQDVEPLFPTLVEGEGLKTLNYAGLSVVAIAALQEQQQKMDAALRERDNRIKALEQAVTALQRQMNERHTD